MFSLLLSRFRKYLDLQGRRGHGTVRIIATLPFNLVAYLRRHFSNGSQIDGFGRTDLPLLASFSRSGTNWIRYSIEWIGQGPTPGNVRLYFTKDYLVDRAHQAYTVMENYPAVILVIRDYRECLLRHLEKEWLADPDVTRFIEHNTNFQQPSWYIENIAAFDRHEGEKVLVYYEDLMRSPETEIPRIAEFLGLDPARVDAYLADLGTHKSESVEAYRKGGHVSATEGGDVGHHAKAKLTPEQVLEFDAYYKNGWPELYERYLSRYDSTVG